MVRNLHVIKGAVAWLRVIWLGSFHRLYEAPQVSGWSLRERSNPLVPWGKHFKMGVNAGEPCVRSSKHSGSETVGRGRIAVETAHTSRVASVCTHTQQKKLHQQKKIKIPSHTNHLMLLKAENLRKKRSIWKCKVAKKKSLNVSSASLTFKYPVPSIQVQTAHSYKRRSCSIL